MPTPPPPSRCEISAAPISGSQRPSPCRSSGRVWSSFLLEARSASRIQGRCKWSFSSSTAVSRWISARRRSVSVSGEEACGRSREVSPSFHAVFRVKSLCAISICNLGRFLEAKRLSGLDPTDSRSGPSEPKVAGNPTLYGHGYPRAKPWRIVLAQSCLNLAYQNTPWSTFAALAVNIGPVSLFAQPDQASLTDFVLFSPMLTRDPQEISTP